METQTEKQILVNTYEKITAKNKKRNKLTDSDFYTIFSVVDKDKNVHSFSFIDLKNRQNVPKLGSQDIVRLSGFLVENFNYSVESIEVQHTGSEEDELLVDLSDQMKDELSAGNIVEANKLVDFAFDKYTQVMIPKVVLREENGNTVSISRGGAVESENDDFLNLITHFTRSWWELWLS